jgi:flagellar protein FlgJ
MKPDDFIGALAGPAWDCMKATGIPASFTVAEAALESGWGAHAPGNNLFGVKATPDWKGAVTTLETSEFIGGGVVLEKATFRAYPDWLSSVLDHAGFLTGNERL